MSLFKRECIRAAKKFQKIKMILKKILLFEVVLIKSTIRNSQIFLKSHFKMPGPDSEFQN